MTEEQQKQLQAVQLLYQMTRNAPLNAETHEQAKVLAQGLVDYLNPNNETVDPIEKDQKPEEA